MYSQEYEDLARLARICIAHLRVTSDVVAARLREIAEEYRERAARLDGGKLPEIGANASNYVSGQ